MKYRKRDTIAAMDGAGHDLPRLPGFREMAQRRQRLLADLAACRQEAALSQTEVAARMGTSQSSVARLEAGGADVRLSTLERYAAAVGARLDWRVAPEDPGGAQ
jgi:ribosome-binding protein aMBF1 (putative translation factor)